MARQTCPPRDRKTGRFVKVKAKPKPKRTSRRKAKTLDLPKLTATAMGGLRGPF